MRDSHVGLLGELYVDELLSLFHLVDVLDAHNTTTPVLAEVVVLVEVGLEHLAEVLEVRHVLRADSGQSDAGSGLLVDELAEDGLAADEAEGNALSAAESGKVHNQLNWVDVVSDHNELGLALLNECGHVVKTELEVDGLGGLGSATGLSLLLESLLLLLAGFGGVLGEQFKELGGYN